MKRIKTGKGYYQGSKGAFRKNAIVWLIEDKLYARDHSAAVAMSEPLEGELQGYVPVNRIIVQGQAVYIQKDSFGTHHIYSTIPTFKLFGQDLPLNKEYEFNFDGFGAAVKVQMKNGDLVRHNNIKDFKIVRHPSGRLSLDLVSVGNQSHYSCTLEHIVWIEIKRIETGYADALSHRLKTGS